MSRLGYIGSEPLSNWFSSYLSFLGHTGVAVLDHRDHQTGDVMQFAVLGFVISNKFTGFRRAVGSEFLDFRFLVLKCHFKKRCNAPHGHTGAQKRSFKDN